MLLYFTRSLFLSLLQIFRVYGNTAGSSVNLSAMVSTTVIQLRFNFNLSCPCSVNSIYSFPHTIISRVFFVDKESCIWQRNELGYRDKSLASRESYVVPLAKSGKTYQTVYLWKKKEIRFEENISRFANELGNWPYYRFKRFVLSILIVFRYIYLLTDIIQCVTWYSSRYRLALQLHILQLANCILQLAKTWGAIA